MIRKLILSLLLLTLSLPTFADEGMWLLMLIGKNYEQMKKRGFKLTPEEIYSVNKACLKDAIISFGGFCTGEIISKDGLILTNHHCGYDAIQKHSTVENDILTNGFWAKNRGEEKAVPGLFAKFLVRMEDVSARINAEMNATMTEPERAKKASEIAKKIKEETEATEKANGYVADVKNMYGGNEFYLFVYEVYNDVRLVGNPPEAVGKFGGDTDNWMWPRHTGDFSMFRVYAGKDNKPAEYAADNQPFKPRYHLPISLKGVKQGDFSMVLGYPGSTDRFLTSPGVDMAINLTNPAFVKIRTKRLALWKEDMDVDKKVRLQYASKYAGIANYWKYFMGQTEICKRLKVSEQKAKIESDFLAWANADAGRKEKYSETMNLINAAYKARTKTELARTFIQQALYAPEIVVMAAGYGGLLKALKEGKGATEMAEELKKELDGLFKDYNAPTDQKILAALYKMYYKDVDKSFHPDIFDRTISSFRNNNVIAQKPIVNGEEMEYLNYKITQNFERFAKYIFDNSIFASKEKLATFLRAPKAETLENDPAYQIFLSVQKFGAEISKANSEPNQKLDRGNRLFIAGVREMNNQKVYYPNANSTMRLTYGQVLEYAPRDGVRYLHATTLDGIIEKEDNSNFEFIVPKKLHELWERKDYGRYAENGTVPVGFITNNDITGGNSGSPVIDGEGRLIGLAFDGNWEAMSDKVAFEPNLQRCINMDIRYVLFCIEKLGDAKHIVDEMTIVENTPEVKKTEEIKPEIKKEEPKKKKKSKK